MMARLVQIEEGYPRPHTSRLSPLRTESPLPMPPHHFPRPHSSPWCRRMFRWAFWEASARYRSARFGSRLHGALEAQAKWTAPPSSPSKAGKHICHIEHVWALEFCGRCNQLEDREVPKAFSHGRFGSGAVLKERLGHARRARSRMSSCECPGREGIRLAALSRCRVQWSIELVAASKGQPADDAACAAATGRGAACHAEGAANGPATWLWQLKEITPTISYYFYRLYDRDERLRGRLDLPSESLVDRRIATDFLSLG